MREGRQGGREAERSRGLRQISRLFSIATGRGLQSRGGISSWLATRLVSPGPHHHLGTVTLPLSARPLRGSIRGGLPVDSSEGETERERGG